MSDADQQPAGTFQPEGESLPPQYFDEVYALNRDPWQFETSAYEAGKYAASLASLPQERYANALEVGCSIGVFTRLLAARCDHLLAVDVAEQALGEARHRCADQPWVRFDRCRLPKNFPVGSFDLVTVCEVGYYWSAEDLELACRRIAQHQPAQATLLLVHWTPEVRDYPLPGNAVHDLWLTQPWWQQVMAARHATYRLDVLQRNEVTLF